MGNKYLRVQVVVGTVIRKNGKYLLVQEGKRQARGLWNVPAGRVEVGDTVEKRAAKEVYEESGFRVKLIRELFVDHSTVGGPVRHAFEGRIIGGRLQARSKEIMDCRWFAWREILKMKKQMRHQWVLKAIGMVEKR
ncbi:MAG: NUDIX domain-containing protein [Patescibacteria group bacterium]|nr:NUDIX domain-containing protein [Patescibacteria group bacterium]MDD5715771.1 NUDIX domain-containing protein [Patescibacteria group bacterium]